MDQTVHKGIERGKYNYRYVSEILLQIQNVSVNMNELLSYLRNDSAKYRNAQVGKFILKGTL
jgi:hypothetical protein